MHRFTEAWRNDNLGRALFEATFRFEQEVIASLAAEGHDAIRPTHLVVFRHLDVEGTRLADLAARAHMTKQGMQDLVDRLEALGMVRRRRDPSDGRAKLVGFTDQGLIVFDAVRRAVLAAHQRIAAVAGSGEAERLLDILHRYAWSSDGEAI